MGQRNSDNSYKTNHLMIRKTAYIFTFLIFFVACTVTQNVNVPSTSAPVVDENLVKNIEEFKAAVKTLQPGDKIILANGTWTDAELKFYGKGTAEKPITLTVEEKGKVFLEGQSNIRVGGEYMYVEGLVFRNGHTPSGSVIAFRKDKEMLCNNCRITECVIDDYNSSERFDSDYWVEIYGKNNRFDHNYLVGKRNRGVTLAVRMKTEASHENFHQIDHNYFGYHPILGSNGGETLRVGTSHYSMSNSNTTVEDNYFEHCNGELEIISSKSGQNTFRNNTFHECQGTLTMRHGNETLVENNYFFANRKANTGGIRIINESQTVRNNYLQGITGYRFRGTLVVMNGVPNSPLNRYFQVKNSEASNNLIIDCDHIQLCAGSDEERSATPIDTKMNNNIFYNTKKDDIFTVYDDISGIEFDGNIVSPNVNFPKNNGQILKKGFETKEIEFVEKDGVKRSKAYPNIGPDPSKTIPGRNNTGVSWYPKKDYQITFATGKVIEVPRGENVILEAVKKSAPGDIIRLTESGNYFEGKSIEIPHTITIEAAPGLATRPEITFERTSLFNLENGGSLTLEGINFSGRDCDDYSGNSVIRTSRYSMINNYKLMIRNCDFNDLDVNHSFNVLRVYKNTFADSILVDNCNFNNITGHVFNLDKEIEDVGIYNAENVVITNSTFKDIGGVALNLYRGGRDESTFGPILDLHNTTFDNVGHDKRNKYQAAMNLHGVQLADMHDLQFKDSKKINLHLIVGEPIIKLKNIKLKNNEDIISNDDAYQRENITREK